MHNYSDKELDRYEKERDKVNSQFMLVTLSLIALFIPIAIAVNGTRYSYKKIREVLKK